MNHSFKVKPVDDLMRNTNIYAFRSLMRDAAPSPFWRELAEDSRLNDLPLPWPEFNRLAAKRFKRKKTITFKREPPLPPFYGTSAWVSYMDDYCEGEQKVTKTGDDLLE